MTVLDNLSPQIHGEATPESLLPLSHGALRFVRGDVRERALMDSLLADCEQVVHLAAETGTGQSMYQIAHYYEVNMQATAQLFELVGTRHRHVKRIVLASSRSVYGEGAYLLDGQLVVAEPRNAQRLAAGRFEPVGPNGEMLQLVGTPEHASPRPASVYAATKLANEQLGRVFADAYPTNVIALRFQNVYGQGQSLRNPYTGILSIFSNRMRQGLPINLFEDGLESRDFVHVSDVVQAVSLTLGSELTGFQVLNIGSGVRTSVQCIATLLRDRLGSHSALQVSGDFRAGDIRHCYADLTQASARLGYAPKVTLEQGLDLFCAWVQQQPVLVDRSDQAQHELSALGLGRSKA